jgi:hypothetical protein
VEPGRDHAHDAERSTSAQRRCGGDCGHGEREGVGPGPDRQVAERAGDDELEGLEGPEGQDLAPTPGRQDGVTGPDWPWSGAEAAWDA